MKITWIGHSCFRIVEGECTIIVDPFEAGSVPGVKDVAESADYVYCSHEHGDHNARGSVKLTGEEKNGVEVSFIDTWHDDEKGAKRGPNRIHIFTTHGERPAKAAHLGDLGCDLTADEIEKLQDLDVLMIPVGGFFTIDAEKAAEIVKALNPRIVIPMHYKSAKFGFDVIDSVDRFALSEERVLECPYSTVDTDNAYEARIVILTPANLN